MDVALQNLTWATLEYTRNCTLAEQYIDLKYEDHRRNYSWVPSDEEQYNYFVAWLPPQYDVHEVTIEVYQQWNHANGNWSQDTLEDPLRKQCLEDYCQGLHWRIDPDIWGIGVSLQSPTCGVVSVPSVSSWRLHRGAFAAEQG